MKLLIVESPGKTKKIQSFLGSDWKVMASVGHVRDLPTNTMGVAAPDFTPHYTETERGREVLARLGDAAKSADEIYLATDPDREGEAIAWHIEDALKLKGAKRVTFAEITEKAVKKAIDQAHVLDMQLVHAQEGRRVLDRLCGYMVSDLVSIAVGQRGLSAGRVQSPAVRLVVDRERAIRNFKVTTHYGVELTFEAVDNITDGWKASWNSKPWLEDGQDYILDKSVAEKVAELRTLSVIDSKESESRSAPPAPFTTSTLQQAASNALKFSPKTTMSLAQRLYEQGHITYMRTDSPNFSEDFTAEARAFCEAQGWPVINKPRTWKSKEGAQEAHEAIRPTHIEIEEAGETADEKKLYQLIRLRSLACMLEDALFAVREVVLEGEAEGKIAQFVGKGRTLVKEGWKIVMSSDQTEDPDEKQEPNNPVPELVIGSLITALEGKLQTKKTNPPKRFTESSLVAELEKKGIGRPSTYAAILDNIIAGRNYLELNKRNLVPTELGEKIVDSLVGVFSFLDFDFTKEMEDALDAIAEGKANYQEVVTQAYNQLDSESLSFRRERHLLCPKCGSGNFRHLVKAATKKDSKTYDFFACNDCKSTYDNVDGKPVERSKPAAEETSFPCFACGQPLSHIKGEKNGKPYDFFACPDKKNCGSTFSNQDGKPVEKKQPGLSEYTCKKCGKALIHRKGISKKTNKPYNLFACSGFPKCKVSYSALDDDTPDWEKERE